MSNQKYKDNEADFWKELFVHLQHKNMVRTNASPLKLNDCRSQFEAFEKSHSDFRISTEYFDSYCTFEVTLTDSIKLRLFVQASIKGSIMQKTGGEYVKLCDAKFPYNPLPEIDEFLKNLPSYLKDFELSSQKIAVSARRQKLAAEFIKAFVIKHINPQTSWTLEPLENGTFLLKLLSSNKTLSVTETDFASKIISFLA